MAVETSSSFVFFSPSFSSPGGKSESVNPKRPKGERKKVGVVGDCGEAKKRPTLVKEETFFPGLLLSSLRHFHNLFFFLLAGVVVGYGDG